ncbi:PilX N-terminal domain-containing pilus assembly protein [Thermodesulfobacteriota bacterium]
MKGKSMMESEDGNVLIISLIILVLLTVIGLSTSRTSSIDIQVAGNNMIYKKNLYTAESACMEAIQLMETADLGDNPPDWLAPGDVAATDIRDNDKWGTSGAFNGATSSTASIDSTNAQFVAISGGVVDLGESLDVTRAKVRQYAVYGRCERNNGRSIIKVGYRKAF